MFITKCLDKPNDIKDKRDYKLASIMPEALEIPEKFLIEKLSPVFRQKFGSCTSAASVNGVKEQQEQKGLSEYFNYVNSKKISGIYDQQGEYIKNALKAICDYGVCSQELFLDVYPPDRQWITYVKKEPSKEAYKDAEKYKGKTYWSMDSYQRNFREALFVFKTPIVFAMKWYSSYNKCDGVLPLPDNWVANHAVCAVGYDDEFLVVKNSFGTGWGDKGYFYIPFKDWEKHTIYSPWILLDKDKTMKYVLDEKSEQYLLDETLKIALNIGDEKELIELQKRGLGKQPTNISNSYLAGYEIYPLVRKSRWGEMIKTLRDLSGF